MIDNEDPTLAAQADAEIANPLDSIARTGAMCPRKPIVCAAYRAGAIVAALFQSMIAYVRSAGR